MLQWVLLSNDATEGLMSESKQNPDKKNLATFA